MIYEINEDEKYIEMDAATKETLIEGAPFILSDFHHVNGKYILFYDTLDAELKEALEIVLNIKI